MTELPGIPEPQGEFLKLSPNEFHILVRQTQGFTARQIADELGIRPKTVMSYTYRAKLRLNADSMQEIRRAMLLEYAPMLWIPVPAAPSEEAAE